MTAEPLAPGAVLGFVGLGKMGSPMVSRLVDAGYRVRCFDTNASALAKAPGTPVPSQNAVAEGAAAVFLMLPSSDAVESVLRDGCLLTALEPGTVLVDMGSSRPRSTRTLGESAAARGVSLVDAPVSGGVSGARNGTLTVMAGGAEDDVARVRAPLGVLGERVRHVGGAGAGHALKALNNLMSAAHLLVSSEALLAGREFGLDPRVMLDALNSSSGRSGSTETKWPRYVLTETFDSGFGAALMLKDMRIAVELARESGWPSRLGEAAVELWAKAVEELPPSADHTQIVQWLQRIHDTDAIPEER